MALLCMPVLPQQLSYSFNRPFSEDQSLIAAVQSFNQDSKGFLWLSGKRTLYRYDGVDLITNIINPHRAGM